jgi:hypothetical protein
MTDLIMPRRKFLTGLMGLVAAPAVVKAINIMPVKVLEYEDWRHTIGLPLQSMAHPVRTGGGVNLAQIREMLMPGLQKMVDDMYAEHPGRWKSVFAGGHDD